MTARRSSGVALGSWAVLVAACLFTGMSASALAQGGAPPGDSLGADTLFFQDGFGDPGAFAAASDDRGSLAYDDGVFRITLTQDGASLWSWANFTERDPVWWSEGSVGLAPGPGSAGLMCGSDLDPDDFLVGAVNGANEWGILIIHDSVTAVVTGGSLPDAIDLSAGGATRLALECAVTGGPHDHVRLWADGALLGSHATAPRIGPFDLFGLFASAPRAPWSATFDDVAVSYGTAYRAPVASPSPAATRSASAADHSEHLDRSGPLVQGRGRSVRSATDPRATPVGT